MALAVLQASLDLLSAAAAALALSTLVRLGVSCSEPDDTASSGWGGGGAFGKGCAGTFLTLGLHGSEQSLVTAS